MPRDRWLIGFLAGTAVLVVAGILAVLLTSGQKPKEYPANTPVGVVQRYLLALESGRATDADEYLSKTVTDKREHVERFPSQRDPDRATRMVLVSEEIKGDTATVVVEITTFMRTDPASSSSWRQTVTFQLKQEAGGWRITSPAYPPF